MKSFKLGQIAEVLQGKLIGDPQVEITGVNGILEAEPGDLTFLANPKYKDKLPLCKASAVVVGLDVEVEGMNLIQMENPRLAFAKLVGMMVPKKEESKEVSPQAYIHESVELAEGVTVYPGATLTAGCKVGKNSVIYANCYLGENVEVGEDCIIYANVTLCHETKIGDRVVINSGTVVGSEGFGYERDGDRHFKVPQAGNVIIEDDVEIGALCAIDRGSVKATIIGRGTKFDNLIHVAHNCQLGENNLLLSQCGIAGTVKTGKNVYFAGKSGCMDHINIVDYAQIGGMSVVTSNIEEEGKYFGYPAVPYREWQKAQAMSTKTYEMQKDINKLRKMVEELSAKLEEKG